VPDEVLAANRAIVSMASIPSTRFESKGEALQRPHLWFMTTFTIDAWQLAT
jgi:hypothetical protein